ncbi:hypothetical protein [Gordonia crocea]|uniref:Uncharacterized protein n=1 Tax=Gordonia crocea TaxID=589162 RepID=A0A7M3STR9_9ACTN|nr:hypothetical protein [Gordonia crocea]GED96043.1 hypothetical protein nbrc107697_00820 [Gordonia crocea]
MKTAIVAGAIALAFGVAGAAHAEPDQQSERSVLMGTACQSVGDTAQEPSDGSLVVCDMNPQVGYPTWLAP